MDYHNTTEISPRLAAALDQLEDITAANAEAGTRAGKKAANMNRQSGRPPPRNSRTPDSTDR